MLIYSFGAENNIPWKRITIDNMEDSSEDFAKAFTLPAEDKRAHRHELFAVETSADGLVIDRHSVGHVEPMDGLERDEVVDFASSIESHLKLNIIIYV